MAEALTKIAAALEKGTFAVNLLTLERNGAITASQPVLQHEKVDYRTVRRSHNGMTGILGSCARVPDAWYVPGSVKVGYEVSFTREFYKPQPLRPLEEIRADLLAVERETEGLLGEILRRTK